MLNFNPPELKDQLIQATKTWSEEFNLDYADDSESVLLDIDTDNFDPSLYEDTEVDANYLVKLELPRCVDVANVTCSQFIRLVEDLKEAKLHENTICRSSKRATIRVSTDEYESMQLLDYILPEPRSDEEEEQQSEIIALRVEIQRLKNALSNSKISEEEKRRLLELSSTKEEREKEIFFKLDNYGRSFLTQSLSRNGADITCSLIKGFSMFGVKVAIEGKYDKYYPPASEEDLFVEIRSSKPISQATENNLFEAYLFELSASLNIALQKSQRPYIENRWLEEPNNGRFISDYRLRPLILGKGTAELLSLYNKAVGTHDLSVQILYFTKTVEYVSQTVIKRRSNEVIRNKLLSRRALDPDAEFIGELELVVERQRKYKKDKEAIRRAIIECCDASELSAAAPPFLGQLRVVSATSKEQDVDKALGMLGQSIYATRNQIAHAKANYTPVGDECPPEQLPAFTECVRIAAQQVVRWYQLSHETIRLI